MSEPARLPKGWLLPSEVNMISSRLKKKLPKLWLKDVVKLPKLLPMLRSVLLKLSKRQKNRLRLRLRGLLRNLRLMLSRSSVGLAKLYVSKWLCWRSKVLNRFYAVRLMRISMPSFWVC